MPEGFYAGRRHRGPLSAGRPGVGRGWEQSRGADVGVTRRGSGRLTRGQEADRGRLRARLKSKVGATPER